MQDYIVETPVRTIHLELQDKEPTSMETTAVPLYLNLHQDLWEIKQMGLSYQQGLDELKAIISEILAAYEAMETETKRYGRVAGYTDEETDHLFPYDGTYKLKLEYLSELAEVYTKLTPLYEEKALSLEEHFRSAEAKRELFEKAFEHFDRQYFGPMLWAHEVLQIDTISLDRDVDNFRGACWEVDQMYDNLIDQWNEQCEAIKAISRRMEELNKHCRILYSTIDMMKAQAEGRSFGSDKAELN